MKYLFLILVFFQFINADTAIKKSDEQKTINEIHQLIETKKINSAEIESLLNELNRIQLTNKVIDVNNLALDIDTDNKVLNEKVELLKEHIKFVLDEQQKRYETLSENQRQMFKTKIELLWWNIGLIATIIAIILGLLSWYGFDRVQKFITDEVDKEINNNHKDVTKNLISELAEDKDFVKLIKAEIDRSRMEEEESNADESFDEGGRDNE